jgi:hypothetical protein
MAAEPPKRSRLEEEVLEILERSDRPPSKPVQLQSSLHRGYWRTRARVMQGLRTGRGRLGGGGWSLILGSALLFLVARVLIAHVSPLLAQLVVYAAVAGIIIGLVSLYRGSARRQSGRMWRGRPVDLDRPGPDLGSKFDDWCRRR